MIQLLKAGCLEFESVSRFGSVQEVECMNSVVVGAVKVFDWIFDPSMLACESISHILILPKDSIDLP